MQLIIKKLLIIIVSIISFQTIQLKLFADEKYNFDDFGLISIMYHRFDESKYPSTNIQIDVFKEQLNIIYKEGIEFIDDGLLSFYENAWPILKEKKIPFILFVNTREVGSFNYMNWDQIIELHKSGNVEIGNHSHSHEYLVDENPDFIKKDILTSIEIFKKKLGKNSDFFSYPFGEYSLQFKKIIKDLGFLFAFGQHSGVIDETKDLWELPRFPINEKYGEIKRFTTLMKTLPLKYKNISPEDRYLLQANNPPKVIVKFQDNIKLSKLISSLREKVLNSPLFDTYNFVKDLSEIFIKLMKKV